MPREGKIFASASRAQASNRFYPFYFYLLQDPHWINVFLQITSKWCGSHETKIGCISLVWTGAKKIFFIFAMRRPFKGMSKRLAAFFFQSS